MNDKPNWELPDSIECLQCGNWYKNLEEYNEHKEMCNFLIREKVKTMEKNEEAKKEFKLDMNKKEHVRIYSNFSKIGGIKATIVELSGLVQEYELDAWDFAHKTFPELVSSDKWIFDVKEKKIYESK